MKLSGLIEGWSEARDPEIAGLTADSRAGLAEELLAVGAEAVLAKPADPALLIAEIARLARQATA